MASSSDSKGEEQPGGSAAEASPSCERERERIYAYEVNTNTQSSSFHFCEALLEAEPACRPPPSHQPPMDDDWARCDDSDAG